MQALGNFLSHFLHTDLHLTMWSLSRVKTCLNHNGTLYSIATVFAINLYSPDEITVGAGQQGEVSEAEFAQPQSY